MSLPTIVSESKLLVLDTKDCYKNNGSMNSHVRFNFDSICINPDTNVLVSLRSFRAPNSIFNINEYNDTFIFSNDGSDVESIVITHKNYTMRSMAQFLIKYTNLIIGYDPTFLSLTFKSTEPFKIYGSGTVNSVLGLPDIDIEAAPYNNADNNEDLSRYAIFSPNAVNFAGTRALSFIVKGVGDQNINRNTADTTNVLAEIPILDRNVIYYNGFGGYHGLYSGESMTELIIHILDENNRFVNFNGLDWSCTLQLDFIAHLTGNNNLSYSMNEFRNKLIDNILAKSEIILP